MRAGAESPKFTVAPDADSVLGSYFPICLVGRLPPRDLWKSLRQSGESAEFGEPAELGGIAESRKHGIRSTCAVSPKRPVFPLCHCVAAVRLIFAAFRCSHAF